MIRSAHVLILLPLMGAGAASAQESAVHVEQQAGAAEPARAAVSVPQIAPQQAAARSGRSGAADQSIAQITAAGRTDRSAPQVTGERGGVSAGTQLSRGGTAESPTPLSRPSEGRTGQVARVEGTDRCAPDAKGAKPAVCARVIETRAAEFARPTPPVLSPEQRLLVDQRLREAGLAGRAVAAGRADAATDPDRLESQALASIVLDQGVREGEAENAAAADAANLPPAAAALIEAIVQRAGGQPPQ